MKENEIDFGKAKVSSLFNRVFFPTLLGMLGMSAMTAIDGIFIGHSVGSDGIAAVNIIVPMIMLLTGVGLMVGMGCSVVSSLHLARGQVRIARMNVTHAILLVTVVAVVVITVMLAFPDASARALGSSEYLLPLVKEYMFWYIPSWIFMLWTAVALFVIRLDGAPNVAMACSLISAVLNIFLDWLFMFPFGWGIMGAAFATLISTVGGGLVAMAYLLFFARRLRMAPVRICVKGLRYAMRNVAGQCRIGFSSLLAEATLAVFMFMGNLVFMRYLGDDGVGAFGIACYYAPFIFMVGNAIAQSAQPIISFNLGLGYWSRIHAAERMALRTAVVCGLIVTSVFVFFPEQLVGLFVPLDNMAARLAVEGFPYFSVGFVFFILNLAVIGYYQSVERMKPASVFALMRGCVYLVPCFLLLPKCLGTQGIWLSLSLSEFATTLSVMVFFFVGRGKSRSLVF